MGLLSLLRLRLPKTFDDCRDYSVGCVARLDEGADHAETEIAMHDEGIFTFKQAWIEITTGPVMMIDGSPMRACPTPPDPWITQWAREHVVMTMHSQRRDQAPYRSYSRREDVLYRPGARIGFRLDAWEDASLADWRPRDEDDETPDPRKHVAAPFGFSALIWVRGLLEFSGRRG